MCYSTRLREEERDERLEQELRHLADQQRERREPAVPIVEHDEKEPVAEAAPEEALAIRT
jgi:hypothetical protein